MKTKLYSALLIIGWSIGSAFPQGTGMVTGTVRNLENGEPLPACNIVLENTALGTTTDTQGNFKLLNIPYGEITVTAHHVGYHEQKIALKITQAMTRVDFRLSPQILSGPGMLVVATRA